MVMTIMIVLMMVSGMRQPFSKKGREKERETDRQTERERLDVAHPTPKRCERVVSELSPELLQIWFR